MLKEKNHKKFRGFWGGSNSATIRKEVIASDSSERFLWNRKATDFEDWERRTSTSSTLHRADPYGSQSCFLDYSLNKKKRWEITAEFEESIEEIQDSWLWFLDSWFLADFLQKLSCSPSTGK